jgi:hypothetical protein
MNDKTKKKDLPGNLNKTEFDLLLESLPKEKRLELRKKRIEILRQGKQYIPKRKDGDVISGGKVLPTMEAAKGGEVKGYKHGGSVKAGRLAKRGYGAAKK